MSGMSISDLARWAGRENRVWEDLWHGRSIGRLAVAASPSGKRYDCVRDKCDFELCDPPDRPEGWTDAWRDSLLSSLHGLAVYMECPGDYCPAIAPPRFVHGQSQGIADLFGAKAEEQPDGNYFVHPLPPDPGLIGEIQPRPLETSIYWGAVEWIRYARSAMQADIPFKNPVMTGPIDTANYLLGTTALLEWVYTNPDVVHELLEKTTDVIIGMMRAVLDAAGELRPLHFSCTGKGFDLCSEVRSIISREIYEEFEAPCLRRIGEELGEFGVHSCGSWERTVPSVLENPSIRAMNGQVMENDLKALCDSAGGKIALSIAPSVNVHDRYTWPDRITFYRYIMGTVPDTQPFEVTVPEDELDAFVQIYREVRGVDLVLPEPVRAG